MTETPKCPYCGAETRLNENNEGIYWYECRECNATGPTEKTPVEAFSAALHRAEPEMRPLTLEEVIAKLENKGWDVVWMECPDLRDDVPMCPSHRRENEAFFLAPHIRACTEALSNYSKTWRCWPRKPTPEQMAAEKWEE